MAGSHDYVAYGLAIRSELELPALERGQGGDVDVSVRLGPLPAAPPAQEGWGSCIMDDDRALLGYEGTATLEVCAGREIVVDPAPDHEPALLRELVVGPGLALAAMQRGLIVLHASAVELEGRALAFLAASGWGKSTLAAELHTRGARLVADDVAAVRTDVGSAVVVPGFPRMKLSPEALARFGLEPATLPPVDEYTEKRSRRVEEGFLGEEVALARIYVLDEGDRPSIEAIAPSEAAIQFVRHNFAAGALQRSDGAGNLERCAELARLVPARRLRQPWNLDAVGETAALVENEHREGG